MPLKSKYSPLSKPSFENIYHAFTSLAPREQLIATIGGILLIVLVIILPLSMVSGKVSKLKKNLTRSQAKLNEVMVKVADFKQLQAEITTLEKQYGRGVSSMTSTIESIVTKAGLQSTIEVLKEKPQVTSDRFIERPVELKMKNVTLKLLIELIHGIESYPTALLRVRNLQIKPRYSNRSFIDVTMDVANIQLQKESEG